MKRNPPWALAAVAVLSFAGGVLAHSPRPRLHPQTLKNLDAAMRDEAFATAKYRLFAGYARDSGQDEVAAAFSGTAETERFDHFSKQAALSDLVGTDADNLKDAIQGERSDIKMYKQFAEQARAAGDTAAADLFDEIGRDETEHLDTFNTLFDKLLAAPRHHM
jgi:rubrerythrin